MVTEKAAIKKCLQRAKTLILGLLMVGQFTSISLIGCNELTRNTKILSRHESFENSKVKIWKSTKSAPTDQKSHIRIEDTQVKYKENEKALSYKDAGTMDRGLSSRGESSMLTHPTTISIYKDAIPTTLQSMPQFATTKPNSLKNLATNYHQSSKRQKRQTGSPLSSSKEPTIKSYYDFVIVEASHKFWSIFEVTTIIIIIYSIFAALYYSKLNPLVSKLDYVDYIGGEDYIGGGRRSNAIDLDFDDSNADELETPATTTAGRAWPSSMAHSMKFILEAIDKLPNDKENKV